MIEKMKSFKNKIICGAKKKKLKSFTLLEMLVVLLIIGVLILLFVPNLTKHRETINKTEKESITKVVETQWELYRLENPSATGDLDDTALTLLKNEGYLKQEQIDAYNK